MSEGKDPTELVSLPFVQKAKRAARWAAIAGGLLALTCHFLPHDYRALCHAIASICTP